MNFLPKPLSLAVVLLLLAPAGLPAQELFGSAAPSAASSQRGPTFETAGSAGMSSVAETALSIGLLGVAMGLADNDPEAVLADTASTLAELPSDDTGTAHGHGK